MKIVKIIVHGKNWRYTTGRKRITKNDPYYGMYIGKSNIPVLTIVYGVL